MSAYREFKRDLLWVVLAFIVLQLIWTLVPVGWDNTDGEKRSGLKPHVDALTGCQYLSTPRGGLYPRLDENGQPLCGRQ